MTSHKGCKRAYKVNQKKDKIRVGMYHPDGGTSGELEFEWIDFSGQKRARIKAYDDSWSALSLFKDLIDEMVKVDNEAIQMPEFCAILDRLGIIDITKDENGVPKNDLYLA